MTQSPSKRVLVLSQNRYGCGASIAAARISHALQQAGSDVYFRYAHWRPGQTLLDDDKALRFFTQKASSNIFLKIGRLAERVFLRQFVARAPSSYLAKYYWALAARNTARRLGVDIVHMHNWDSGHFLATRLIDDFLTVWTMHDEAAYSGYNYKVELTDKSVKLYGNPHMRDVLTFQKRVLNCQNLVLVSPSEWLANLASEGLKPFNEVRIINQFAGDEFFRLDKDFAKQVLKLDPDRPNILFLAGNGARERKNHDQFLQQIDDVLDSGFSVSFIGNPGDKIYAHPHLHMSQSESNKTKLNLLYNAADYFCIPSLIDNHPNTVIESQYAGTPVLAANTGGTCEMIEDGKTGVLFDPYKEGWLHSTLEKAERTDLKSAADIASYAIARYHPQRVVEEYWSVYDSLVETRSDQAEI